jgi:hypothetical protein
MRHRRHLAVGLLLLAGGFVLGHYASRVRAAGTPTPLTYSGVVSNPDGTARGGPATILVQLFDQESAGTAVCGSLPTKVTLVGGAFRVPLSNDCTTAVHARPDLWAEVTVDGQVVGRRRKLGTVPYALEADHAATSTTAQTATALAPGPIAGGLIVITVAGNSIGPPCAFMPGSSTVVDCTCPAGSFAVSGGADAGINSGRFIRESRPLSATTWRMTCVSGNADVLCTDYAVVCSRLGP